MIGSSISGRLETKIGLGRLTTIAMPMRGRLLNYRYANGTVNNVLTCQGIDAELRPRKPYLHDKSASEEDANAKVKAKYEVVDPIGL